MKFDALKDYAIDGGTLNSLWRVYERLNDGMSLSYEDRRNLAKRLEAMLISNRFVEIKPPPAEIIMPTDFEGLAASKADAHEPMFGVFDGADIVETFPTEQAATDYINKAGAAGTNTSEWTVLPHPENDTPLTWVELKQLKKGTKVKFLFPWDVYGCVIPAGSTGTVCTNGLHGGGALEIKSDDHDVIVALGHWNGAVYFSAASLGPMYQTGKNLFSIVG